MHLPEWIYERRPPQSEGRRLRNCFVEKKKEKKKEKADLKDLFLSTPRMHDIFNLFIWVKQSFQGGKPTRRDKAELCLAPTPPQPCLQQGRCTLAQIYSVVIVFVCDDRMWGGASTGALGWCIIFCLLFVLLFIDRLIVTLDMSVVMEDLGTKTQVAAPRHRRTSQTGELIKHDQYFPLPLYPFIYSFLSHGLYSCGRKKACCQSAETVLLSHTIPQ